MNKQMPDSQVGREFVHFGRKINLVLTDIQMDEHSKLAQAIQTANHVLRNVQVYQVDQNIDADRCLSRKCVDLWLVTQAGEFVARDIQNFQGLFEFIQVLKHLDLCEGKIQRVYLPL